MTVCAHGNQARNNKGHFGPDEHDYSHWMALNLPNGSITLTLRVLLFIRPEAASKARRDATPLRLISWLSYKLNPELEQFIEQAMEHLSTWKVTEGFFFYCIAELAIKPCRSSRSNTRGGVEKIR